MAAVQCFCPLTCCQVTIHIFKQSQYRDSQKISLDLHNILTHFYFCFQMKWTWKDIFLAHMLPQLSTKTKIWKILKLLNYFIVLPKSNTKQMSALEYRLWGVRIVLSTMLDTRSSVAVSQACRRQEGVPPILHRGFPRHPVTEGRTHSCAVRWLTIVQREQSKDLQQGFEMPKTAPLPQAADSICWSNCCCSVAKSCPDCATPWTAARQASLFFTISQSLLKLMSIEWMMPSNHRILCRSLLLLPSIFPSIRVKLLQFIYWKDTTSVLPVSTLLTSWSLLYRPDEIPPFGIYNAHFLVCGFSMGQTIQNIHWRNSTLSFGVVKSLFFSYHHNLV